MMIRRGGLPPVAAPVRFDAVFASLLETSALLLFGDVQFNLAHLDFG